MYPTEYRDYRDYQFFLLSIPGGHGDWGIPIGIWYTRWRKRRLASGGGGFYGIIFKGGVAGAAEPAVRARIFDGTGGDRMQERDGTALGMGMIW